MDIQSQHDFNSARSSSSLISHHSTLGEAKASNFRASSIEQSCGPVPRLTHPSHIKQALGRHAILLRPREARTGVR